MLGSAGGVSLEANSPPAVGEERNRSKGRLAMLATPRFHHLHLNSLDPDAALDFYARQFPSTRKGDWGGLPALSSPNNVLVLFTKVAVPPPLKPQSAIWHFGWHVRDARERLKAYKSRPDVELLPLYTSAEGDRVFISSDTWPGASGTLGRTKGEIAEARANGIRPTGGAGFADVRGPDRAIVEYAGNYPVERFNHIHFFEEEPLSALLWYQRHLNAALYPPFTSAAASEEAGKTARRRERTWPALERDGMLREPRAGVLFGDVAFLIYPNQGKEPLFRSRGQLQDHIALAVADLDAWTHKLDSEGVPFLERPYRLGETRAAMIEGPSREAIELVEA
jgi:catechol 2,3-dioxygenase-like lactoylglutathione lyase family enzyme